MNEFSMFCKAHFRRAVTASSLALVALAIFPTTALAERERNEAKASRYLYCAAINRYWVEMLRETDPSNKMLHLRKDATDRFWQASNLMSDLEYSKANLAIEAEKVKAIVMRAEQDKGEEFRREDLSCANTLNDEVVPLFRSLGLAPPQAPEGKQ
jgi:hypothetical protein